VLDGGRCRRLGRAASPVCRHIVHWRPISLLRAPLAPRHRKIPPLQIREIKDWLCSRGCRWQQSMSPPVAMSWSAAAAELLQCRCCRCRSDWVVTAVSTGWPLRSVSAGGDTSSCLQCRQTNSYHLRQRETRRCITS